MDHRSKPRQGLDDVLLEELHDRLWSLASQTHHRLLLESAGREQSGDARDADPSGFYEHEFGHPEVPGAGQDELAALCHAMDLIAQGRYGRCDACAIPIPVDRLRQRPHLLCCADCEMALRVRFGGSRPSTFVKDRGPAARGRSGHPPAAVRGSQRAGCVF